MFYLKDLNPPKDTQASRVASSPTENSSNMTFLNFFPFFWGHLWHPDQTEQPESGSNPDPDLNHWVEQRMD
jgi:hypothetical protein